MRIDNRDLSRRLVAHLLIVIFALPLAHPALTQVGPIGGESKSSPHPAPTDANVFFEENVGQFDPSVKYLARTPGGNVFLTGADAVYVLPLSRNDDSKAELAYAVRMRLANADPNPIAIPEDELSHHANYFRGDDPARWRTGVRNYSVVRFANVYAGVDMVWRGAAGGTTRYDLIVQPGGDPSQIAIELDGADRISVDSEGDLLVDTEAGTIRQKKPFSFQETEGGLIHEVPSRFVIEGGQVKFWVDEFDRSRELVIDPTVSLNNLAFSTFLGSFGDDLANDIVVDSAGYSYITGRTLSAAFPTTVGTFDPTSNGAEDVFVAKLNASGTGLVFSTFLGGTTFDEGRGIAVDQAGNVYVASVAGFAFPTTAGAYDTTFNGGVDVGVTKLNPTGSALLYSTYIGTSQSDLPNDLAIDSAGNAFIVTRTPDTIIDFPTTPGAFDTTHNGSDDVAVTKLSTTGSALVYSTFLGGSGIDVGNSIVVNAAGEAYVGGTTTDDAVDFPTTAGSYDTTHNGVTDHFVTRISADGSSLIFSTFIGGPGIDNGNAIAIDAAGNVHGVGTASPSFPTTPGVFDTTAAGGGEGALFKISADGSTLIYSTFIGGTGNESGRAVAVDASGFAYVVGNTESDFPVTAGAYDTSYNGGTSDAFLLVANPTATAITYATFIGGSLGDLPNDIALDATGNVYIAGQTTVGVTPFPTTPQAFQIVHGGAVDAFVCKFGSWAISGRVIDTAGNPISSVMIAMSGQASGFMVTGFDGRFGFTNGVPHQPHAISASRPGYTINPSIFNIATLDNNRELIFVGAVGSPTGGAGGTLAFQNSSFTKAENQAFVTVTVTRSHIMSGQTPVTVDYATADGTAVAASDYTPTAGVLTFNAFETSKTITIPITNDQTLEPRETFSITLSNATNNAEIEIGRETTTIQITDDDLANGDLLISEFRQRGRLGPNDEYIKLFNPHPFDVTVQTADGSSGLSVLYVDAAGISPVATIPNLVTIPARGHYMLTNNSPVGGFSLIDYPTGNGSTTAVGDRTYSVNIPDNSDIALLRTSDEGAFVPSNVIDTAGFGNSEWTTEGKSIAKLEPDNSEFAYVRRYSMTGPSDTGNNLFDFLLLDATARTFSSPMNEKLFSTLGAPAPGTVDSLPLMTPGDVWIGESLSPVWDPTPVPNGRFGTMTIYRTITNNTSEPIIALRLRAVDFQTEGSFSQKRTATRPDFRLMSSLESHGILGVSLAAERLLPAGGGLNSTLTVDSINSNDPLQPGQTVVVAIRFGVMRYGRLTFVAAVEALR